MKKFIIYLLKPFSFLPALAMMYLIFSFSGQTGVESGNLSHEIPSLEVSTIFFRSTNDILPLTNALK